MSQTHFWLVLDCAKVCLCHLFIIIMDRISLLSQGAEAVRFSAFMSLSLFGAAYTRTYFFVEYVVLLASLIYDLQLPLG